MLLKTPFEVEGLPRYRFQHFQLSGTHLNAFILVFPSLRTYKQEIGISNETK